MAYSVDEAKAKAIAVRAHAGAIDKAGAPYIKHPERVALRCTDPAARVVAWLHDVVEDTGITLSYIAEQFGCDTAEAVDAVTHREDEPWSDYLVRVKLNPVATAVKIADLIDNSNLSRFAKVTSKDVLRQAKYNRALMFLMNTDGV